MGKSAALAAAFGKILRRMRTAAKFSQSELAARCKPKMKFQAIARYEAGGSVPSIDVVKRLAKALDVDPCELIPK